MKTIVARVLLVLTVSICAAGVTSGARIYSGEETVESYVKLGLDLSGVWKFRTDPTDSGQKLGWHTPGHDYSTWKTINVPGDWESQGFTDATPKWQDDDLTQPYSGYAWYQKSVVIPDTLKGMALYLNFGRIDDMDWVYVNGLLVGQTTTTGQDSSSIRRSYLVPQSAIKFGKENIIVVRVLDMRGAGGIVEGPVSLSTEKPESHAEPGSPRREDKVQFIGSVVVGPDETVGDAVAIGGSVTVLGRVTGDAVAIGGSVRVMPEGHVDGDAVAIGGRVIKDPGAFVGGEVQGIGIGGPNWHGPTNWRDILLLDMRVRLFKLLAAVLFAGLAALIVVLFPARIETVADVALSRPGGAALFGLLVVLLALPVAILLLATCVGIPLIPVEALLLVAAKVVGHTAIGLAIGRRLGDAIHRPISSGLVAAVIGVLVLALVRLAPVAGDMLAGILILIGFGATLATGFGTHPDWFEKRMWRRSPPPAA